MGGRVQLRSARAARLPVSLPVLPLPIVVPEPLAPEPLVPEPLAPMELPLPVVPLLALGEVVLGVLLLDEELPLAPLALVSLDEDDGVLLLPLLPEAPIVPVEPLELGDAVVEPLPLGDAALVPLGVVLLLLELWAIARPPNARAQDATSVVRVVLVVLIAYSLTAWEWWVATPASGRRLDGRLGLAPSLPK